MNHLLNQMQYLDYMSKPEGGIGAALLTPLNIMDLVGLAGRKGRVAPQGKLRWYS